MVTDVGMSEIIEIKEKKNIVIYNKKRLSS